MTFHDTGPGAGIAQLWPALAASIALHAVLLAGFPDVWTFPEPPQIVARLTAWIEPGLTPAAVPPAPPAPAATPAVAAAREKAPRPVVAPLPRKPQDETRESSTPVQAPRVQQPPAVEPATVAAASPSGAAASGEGARPAAPATPAPEAGEGAPDPGSLAQYRLALIGVAKRHKLYPSHAIDRGWQGRVDVRLVIGANGEPAGTLVKRSSGHDLLYRQALEMIRKAAALTPVPPALRNREFAVDVPILFELKSES